MVISIVEHVTNKYKNKIKIVKFTDSKMNWEKILDQNLPLIKKSNKIKKKKVNLTKLK